MLDENLDPSISPRERDSFEEPATPMGKATINDFGDVYSAYAAGCLDPAFCLLVETQSVLRPDVARAVAKAETIAGVFFETEDSAALSAGAIDTAMAMIDAFEAGEATPPRAAIRMAGEGLDELLDLPEPLRETALTSFQTSKWQNLTQGIRRLKLDAGSQAEVELYRIEPGCTVPEHSHSGSEFTLVVSGGFTDESGSYGPGDLSLKGPRDTHQPTGDMDGVCYALAIREGGLKFTGMMGFLQRLVGQ
ncbi:MAG: ChrR family anti-sigma-E factor [Pseudomonadota bacterium]